MPNINKELTIIQELQATLENERKNHSKIRAELHALKKSQENTRLYEQKFLLNMSHEFMTSLNSILILSKLLSENKDENLEKKQLDYAQIINDYANELLSDISDIQDLANIMSGNITLNFEEISIIRLANYLKDAFEAESAAKGLKLIITVVNTLPGNFRTDRFCLEKILKNLISNAIKYTNKGKVIVSFDYSKDTEKLNIHIEDTGIGIASDKKQEIFEGFQAYAEDVKHSLTGIGLGLSISTALAELMHGKIKLKSQKGKGSMFTLILPTQKISSIESIRNNGQSEIVADILSVNSIRDDRLDLVSNKQTMLVVEDDPNSALILFDVSRENGFQCLIADDGEAALHLANQYMPTAIILNIGLPRIDGIEVLKRLKNSSRTHHIPVYVISKFKKRYDAIANGALGFLAKPVTMDKLSKSIERIKTMVNLENQKVVLTNFNGNSLHFALQYIQKNSIEHINISNSFDIREFFRNNLGKCIITDNSQGSEQLHNFFQSLTEDETMLDVPVIIAEDKIHGTKSLFNLESYTDKLVIIHACSESELKSVHESLLSSTYNTEKKKQGLIMPDFDDLSLYKNKTVLIADNNKRDTFTLSSMLDEKGINVITSHSGKKTLEHLRLKPEADMLIVNLSLTDLDGLSIIKTLRKQPKLEHLPVIVTSDKGIKGDRQKCIRAGANDYLSKPIAPEKLIAMLQVWLNT